MTSQEVVELMSAATSEADWNRRCDEVKRRCNGYPEFWFTAVLASGLAAKIAKGWKR